MKHLAWFAMVITLGTTVARAQAPTVATPVRSPRETIESLWKRATTGDLLTAAGWQRASGLFAQSPPYPGDGVVRVVSNHWGIENSSIEGETAMVTIEYEEAGRIDSQLRYTPPSKTTSFKSAMIFRLVLAPTYLVMYKADGKTIKKKTPTSKEWQISDPAGPPWTTVNTAIRYVLEMRKKTADPTLKRNADQTLAKLLEWR